MLWSLEDQNAVHTFWGKEREKWKMKIGCGVAWWVGHMGPREETVVNNSNINIKSPLFFNSKKTLLINLGNGACGEQELAR